MNLQEQLTERDNGFNAEALALKIIANKALQKELFKCFFSGRQPLSSRAAWVLSHCHDHAPDIIKPYESRLIGLLKTEGLHDGIIRNILRIYQTHPVPETQSAEMLDMCYSFIKNSAQAIAIRTFSITVAFNISKKYPELLDELKIVLQEIYRHEEAPALKARSKNTLKSIEKLQGIKKPV